MQLDLLQDWSALHIPYPALQLEILPARQRLIFSHFAPPLEKCGSSTAGATKWRSGGKHNIFWASRFAQMTVLTVVPWKQASSKCILEMHPQNASSKCILKMQLMQSGTLHSSNQAYVNCLLYTLAWNLSTDMFYISPLHWSSAMYVSWQQLTYNHAYPVLSGGTAWQSYALNILSMCCHKPSYLLPYLL